MSTLVFLAWLKILNLGSNLASGSQLGLELRNGGGVSKVSNLDLVEAIDEDVLAFDVSVADSLHVDGAQSLDELLEQLHCD